MRTLLIDGDSIAWRASSSAVTHGDDPVVKAIQMVEKLKRELNANRAVIALSSPDRRYWRHGIDPLYKGDRKEPPQSVRDIHAGIAGGNRFVRQILGLEADDLIGMLATSPEIVGEKVIVADDAHLLQVPGRHHRPKKFKPGVTVLVDSSEAECRHLQQALAEYCPRVALPTAEKLVGVFDWISSPAMVWRGVVATFVKHGATEADALRAAQITRVCRHDSINPDTLEPILWQPPVEEERVLPPAPTGPVPTSLFAGDGPAQKWA